MTPPKLPEAASDQLLGELRSLIERSRRRVATSVNAELVMLYWRIGQRIRRDVLRHDKPEYGARVVDTLARQLTAEYGRGFGKANIFNMIRVFDAFPDERIFQTLSGKLSWSHFCSLVTIDDPLRRDFYSEMCRVERWSVRALRAKIRGMLFERTAISHKPEALARHEVDALREADRISPDLVFRDPYLLDFLGLADTYSEKDLETAILREMERFLLELGSDFSFVARQKRIMVDGEDYYLDLLFFHRRLRRLVAIELKLGRFRPADKGQMELYLSWLARHEQRPGESAPLGLILCAGKSNEHVELLQLERSRIRVAAYLTELPPRDVLERKLHELMRFARERQARCSSTG